MKNLDTNSLKQALASEDIILFGYLFGSHVTGKATSLSDVDVAIYPARKLSADDRLGIIQQLGKKTKLDNLDVTFLDRLENLYLLNAILDHGVVLVDNDEDQRDIFEISARHRFFDFRYQRKLYMGV
ncbi:MAG TPA: nucleotidyltransferase domain-containing protein [bacterium]